MGERACIGSRGTCAAAWSCCPTRWPTSTSDEVSASRQLPQYHPFSLLTQNQTSTTSTLLATVEPAMTTTAACAVERRMQAMAVWPSPPGAISTLSTPSTRPTRTPRRRMGRGKKCFKASGQVFQASNTKSFLPASLHHSSLLLLRIIAINHIGTGWVVVVEQIPPKTPPPPQKKKKKKKKKKS